MADPDFSWIGVRVFVIDRAAFPHSTRTATSSSHRYCGGSDLRSPGSWCRRCGRNWGRLAPICHVDLTIATSIDNNAIPQIPQKIPMTVPELALGLKFCPNIANSRTSPDRNTIVNCAQKPIQPHSRKVMAIFRSMGWV